MSPWKRICCAVDLGETTEVVVGQAAALAGWLGAELLLLHVVPQPASSAWDLAPGDEDSRELESSVQHELAYWRDEAQGLARHPVSIHEAHGEPAEEILRFAESHRADAVVVGTHGRRGLERLVLGSVAEQVARRAHCPVLVAHPTEDRGRRPTAETGVYAES